MTTDNSKKRGLRDIFNLPAVGSVRPSVRQSDGNGQTKERGASAVRGSGSITSELYNSTPPLSLFPALLAVLRHGRGGVCG